MQNRFIAIVTGLNVFIENNNVLNIRCFRNHYASPGFYNSFIWNQGNTYNIITTSFFCAQLRFKAN